MGTGSTQALSPSTGQRQHNNYARKDCKLNSMSKSASEFESSLSSMKEDLSIAVQTLEYGKHNEVGQVHKLQAGLSLDVTFVARKQESAVDNQGRLSHSMIMCMCHCVCVNSCM